MDPSPWNPIAEFHPCQEQLQHFRWYSFAGILCCVFAIPLLLFTAYFATPEHFLPLTLTTLLSSGALLFLVILRRHTHFYTLALGSQSLVLREGSVEHIVPFQDLQYYLDAIVPQQLGDYCFTLPWQDGLTLVTGQATYYLHAKRYPNFARFVQQLEHYYLCPLRQNLEQQGLLATTLHFGKDLRLQSGCLQCQNRSIALKDISGWRLIHESQLGPSASRFLLCIFGSFTPSTASKPTSEEPLFCKLVVKTIGNRPLLQYVLHDVIPALQQTP